MPIPLCCPGCARTAVRRCHWYRVALHTERMSQAMREHRMHALMHFTGLKSVADPVREGAALMPMNPYGMSKALGETLLAHACARRPTLRVAALHYFKPVGAHQSGQIGEDLRGVPANLMPCICQVATGRRELLQIYGDDYPTPDGTALRDYIHVEDLAEGPCGCAAAPGLARQPGQHQPRDRSAGLGAPDGGRVHARDRRFHRAAQGASATG